MVLAKATVAVGAAVEVVEAEEEEEETVIFKVEESRQTIQVKVRKIHVRLYHIEEEKMAFKKEENVVISSFINATSLGT